MAACAGVKRPHRLFALIRPKRSASPSFVDLIETKTVAFQRPRQQLRVSASGWRCCLDSRVFVPAGSEVISLIPLLKLYETSKSERERGAALQLTRNKGLLTAV